MNFTRPIAYNFAGVDPSGRVYGGTQAVSKGAVIRFTTPVVTLPPYKAMYDPSLPSRWVVPPVPRTA